MTVYGEGEYLGPKMTTSPSFHNLVPVGGNGEELRCSRTPIHTLQNLGVFVQNPAALP